MKKLLGISINVILLGMVSLLNDTSSEMIMPILPMFITALGGSGVAIGLIGGFRDSIANILKVFCGYFSDKLGKRKIFVSSGYLTSAFFKLMLFFSRIWQHVLLISSFERIGKGLRTAPRDAIIADSMKKKRGKGFGVHRAFDTSGAILGSLLAFLLFWYLGLNFRSIILIAAIISFFSLLPLYFVREKKGKKRKISLEISFKRLPKNLKLFILIATIFALGNFSYMFFILRVKEFFIGKYSTGIPILLYVVFNVFYALFAVPFGSLSDRIGRKKVIVSGYFLFFLTCLGFAFMNSSTSFFFLFALYGLVYAMIDGNQRAFVSDLSSKDLRATALGTFHTSIGLATLPASVIAGFLWQYISPIATFMYGGVMSLISVIIFLLIKG